MKDEIIKYILDTPFNTNKRVLSDMLDKFAQSSEGDKTSFNIVNNIENLPEGANGNLCLVLTNTSTGTPLLPDDGNDHYSETTYSSGIFALGNPNYTAEQSITYFNNLIQRLGEVSPNFSQASGTYHEGEDPTRYYAYDSQQDTYTDITNTLHNGDSLEYYYVTHNNDLQVQLVSDTAASIQGIVVIPVGGVNISALKNTYYENSTALEISNFLLNNNPTYPYVIFAKPTSLQTQDNFYSEVEINNIIYTKELAGCIYCFENLTSDLANPPLQLQTGWNALYELVNKNDDEDSFFIIEPFSNITQILSVSELQVPQEVDYKYNMPYGSFEIFNGILCKLDNFNNGFYLKENNSWIKVSTDDIIEHFSS